MKFHINPKTGEVSACRARVKCRFGGPSGDENHFTSKEDAEKASELQLAKAHPQTPVRKHSTAFTTSRENIKKVLADNGMAKASTLPPVNSKSEMIEKWFGGDRRKYEVVARIADPKSELNEETRQSMGRFVSSGVGVSIAKDSEFDRAPSALSSDVELIEDLDPEDFVTFEDIKSGRRKAF